MGNLKTHTHDVNHRINGLENTTSNPGAKQTSEGEAVLADVGEAASKEDKVEE